MTEKEYELKFIAQVYNYKEIIEIIDAAQESYKKYVEITEGKQSQLCMNIIKIALLCLLGFVLCVTTKANILITGIFFICLGLSGTFSFLYLSLFLLPTKTWLDCIKDEELIFINSSIVANYIKSEEQECILLGEKPKKWYLRKAEKVLIQLNRENVEDIFKEAIQNEL